MIIIGERINATRKSIAAAIEKKDKEFIKKEAQKQIKCGADFLDLNAGLGKGREKEDLAWLIETVQEIENFPLCLDSADPEVLGFCLPMVKNEKKMINSITGEKERLKNLIPVIKKHSDSNVIALTMDDRGIPGSPEVRVGIAEKLITLLTENGVKEENIFVDCLVQPVSVAGKNARVFIDSLKGIKKFSTNVKITCGLSNVSFGLPERKVVNKYFLAIALYEGLDSAIIDPTEFGMQEAVLGADLLTGKDEFCMNYIQACRQEKI